MRLACTKLIFSCCNHRDLTETSNGRFSSAQWSAHEERRRYSRFILPTLSKNKQRVHFGKVQIVPQKNVNEASQFLLWSSCELYAQEKILLGFQTHQNKKSKLQKGSGESWAVSLTWNPRLVKLIRGKGKSCAAGWWLSWRQVCRWHGQKVPRCVQTSEECVCRHSRSSSSSSVLGTVRHEGCGRVRLDPTQSIGKRREGVRDGRGWSGAKYCVRQVHCREERRPPHTHTHARTHSDTHWCANTRKHWTPIGSVYKHPPSLPDCTTLVIYLHIVCREAAALLALTFNQKMNNSLV